MILSVGFMMTGNMVAYGLSVAWSWFQHDQDPEFPEKRKLRDKLQTAYDRDFGSQVSAELDFIDKKAEKSSNTARTFGRSIASADGFEDAQRKASSVLAQDKKVAATLSIYRSCLIDQLSKSQKTVVFEYPIPRTDGGKYELINPAEFLAKPIHLSAG